MKFKKLSIYFMILFLSSCATSRMCPSVEAEPVSTCRAKAECGGGGAAIGMMLAGFNPTSRPNSAIVQYDQCIENSLSAQRSNAGVQSNNYNCKTVETYPGHFESKCNQQ